MTKTLLVGLDAACWDYLDPLLHNGGMPTLQSLMNAGTWGTLHSTMPPWTPTAWASLATGKNPGKHGIFDMTWRRPGTYDFIPMNASVRSGTPFWQRLNEGDVRVGLVNVPFTYPPEPVNGFMVTGFGTPGSARDVTYPSDLLSRIQQEFGPYEPTVAAEFLQSASPLEIQQAESAHQSQQVKIAAELAQRCRVDVLVINLMLTDHANHKMPCMEQVQEAYRRADVDLGYLIDVFDPDNVMLISDHGSSRLKGDFLLNTWLEDNGYYVQAANGVDERAAALNWLLAQWLQKHYGWSGPMEKVLRRLLRENLFRLPARLQARFWKRINTFFPFAREYVIWSNRPNYQRTQVFPGSAYAGLLYLNVVGREATGVVPPEARQKLAAEIAEKLRQVVDPETGRSLFTNVYTAEELYTGPAAAYAPDLIVDGYSSTWNIRTSRHTMMPEHIHHKYFVEATNGRDFGWHSRDGIFIFSGPAFKVGRAACEGELVDIPATLLHLHNVPIPDDYDGRILTEVFTSEWGRHSIRYQPGDTAESGVVNNAYSAEEAREVLSHLKALGYLD